MNELNRQISICFFAGKITLLKLFKSTLPTHNNALNDKAKLLLNFIHTDGTKKNLPVQQTGLKHLVINAFFNRGLRYIFR